jgi:hypothetical protein
VQSGVPLSVPTALLSICHAPLVVLESLLLAGASTDVDLISEFKGVGVSAPSADNYRYCARFKINVNSGSEQLIRAGISTSRNEFPYQRHHRV